MNEFIVFGKNDILADLGPLGFPVRGIACLDFPVSPSFLEACNRKSEFARP
jgi:hypothetical protein